MSKCTDRAIFVAEQYSGGSKGGQERPAPPGPISFIFMQFSGKIWQNSRFLPPPLGFAPTSSPPSVWEILDPPLQYVCKCLDSLQIYRCVDKYLTVYFYHGKRKSSCVNARGIPPAV